MNNRRGELFVVTGPSGVGKATVLGRLMKIISNVYISISATTRKPREGEIHGKHYFFMDRNEFEKLIENDRFLEYAEYVGNYYGTPADSVEQMLANGKDVILEIEPQGALKIKEKCPDCTMLFIIPPCFSDLEFRLRSRGTESDEVIAKRLEKAKKEYEYVDKYDYIVVNDDIDKAADEIRCIMLASRYRTEKRKYLMR
ncbi:MAG: guanylate kinase, partial [Clostridia bacterium]|nr:guanylate kinase [Clostridia bacterium]MBQ6932903.1 guanylate kinase [Clostridia bacterium]